MKEAYQEWRRNLNEALDYVEHVVETTRDEEAEKAFQSVWPKPTLFRRFIHSINRLRWGH